jgi:hypothetical protein
MSRGIAQKINNSLRKQRKLHAHGTSDSPPRLASLSRRPDVVALPERFRGVFQTLIVLPLSAALRWAIREHNDLKPRTPDDLAEALVNRFLAWILWI